MSRVRVALNERTKKNKMKKNKMKKKIALVLTMITVMGFAACGDKNGAKETTSIPEITETIMKDIAKKQTEEIITLLEDEAFFFAIWYSF